MVQRRPSKLFSDAGRGSGISLLTVAMPVRNYGRHCAMSRSSRCRSSNEQTRQRASRCYRVAGLWSAHSPGLEDADDWPRIGRNQSRPLKPGCCSPTSAFSPEGSQDTMFIEFFSSQALRLRKRTSCSFVPIQRMGAYEFHSLTERRSRS